MQEYEGLTAVLLCNKLHSQWTARCVVLAMKAFSATQTAWQSMTSTVYIAQQLTCYINIQHQQTHIISYMAGSVH